MPMGIPPCDVGCFCFRTNNEGGSLLFPARFPSQCGAGGGGQRLTSVLRRRSVAMQVRARSAPFEATTSDRA